MDTTLIFLLGATASGKSKLAYDIARKLNIDIISCDSAQVYKLMDIGTAKPTAEERRLVTHHMIDVVDIDCEYNVANYVNDCAALLKKNKKPFFVGGTGLYVNSLLYGYNFASVQKNTDIRNNLEIELKENGIDYMYEKLRKVDEKSCLCIHKNNVVRVLRALEIFYSQGSPKSSLETSLPHPIYKYKIFAIDIDRNELYKRIDLRVDRMIASGLVEEVEGILTKYNKNLQSLRAIGYKEIIEYLSNECSLGEAINNIKLNTRHYAKRQITWLRHKLPDVQWLKEKEYDKIYNTMSDIIL